MARAGLQCHIKRGAGELMPPPAITRILQRAALSMRLPGALVVPLTQHMPIFHNNCTHRRIRAGGAHTALSQLERAAHPARIIS